jgi:phage replication-related protein YjqB (UPF0714/DUF867 family)
MRVQITARIEARMRDTYRCFEELAATEREGVDYEIVTQVGSTGVLFIAPHGGGIELGTAELAQDLAGRTHSY